MNSCRYKRFHICAWEREAGLALVSALLILVVITLLGVSLFLGVNLQQQAAGNSMEKARALEVAQSVTIAAEQWLDTYAKTIVPVTCGGMASVFRLCAVPPNTPADPKSWATAGATQVNLKQVKISTNGGPNTYAAYPAVWITYLGRATMGPGNLYEIDAQAYGGNTHTVAVTQVVYYVGGNTRNSTPVQGLGQ
jgi:type IV pilus assembly protein PilX